MLYFFCCFGVGLLLFSSVMLVEFFCFGVGNSSIGKNALGCRGWDQLPCQAPCVKLLLWLSVVRVMLGPVFCCCIHWLRFRLKERNKRVFSFGDLVLGGIEKKKHDM